MTRTDADAEPEYYSLRRLNPFLGTQQIIEAGITQAISQDGQHWRIHIRSDIFHPAWNMFNTSGNSSRYQLYGVWSNQGDLSRLPIHPALYRPQVEESVMTLLNQMPSLVKQIPFPPRDSIELWLLDQNHKHPLALLASALPDDEITDIRHTQWIASRHDDLSFTSSSELVTGIRATTPVYARDVIQQLINGVAGSAPAACWIQRQANGEGITIQKSNVGDTKLPLQFTAKDFPELGIALAMFNSREQHLLNEFIHWQAPFLLSLPNLSPITRSQLEIAAANRPLLVHALYRIYPEVRDTSLLNKILVEAVLRKTEVKS